MLRFTIRRVAALASIGVIALVGSAMAAAGKKVTSCDNRAGKTLLEDGTARVYKLHGLDYACARPTGRASKLFRSETPGVPPKPAAGIELAGGYAAWSQIADDNTATVVVLDVATGTYRIMGSIQERAPQALLGAFVVNSHGTVVYSVDSQACAAESCYASTTLTANSAHGRSTLASVSDSSGTSQPSLPITSLGLSNDGTVAFWIDKGKYKGASIP